MHTFKYNEEKDYDEHLPIIVNQIKTHINSNDDDFLTIIVGDTGSGKSNLGLHV